MINAAAFWVSIISVYEFYHLDLGDDFRAPCANIFLENFFIRCNPQRAVEILEAAGYSLGPDGTRVSPDGEPLDFRLFAHYVLIMRSSLLEVMREDYMLTARAKGVTNRNLLLKHALPNAMLPVVTLIAINLGFIVAGSIQIETVFSWPGLGRLMYSSLTIRDYPVLQGLFLFITSIVILANFCADILYRYLDPRVKS